MRTDKKRVFNIASDLIWSIAGLMLMNGLLQLLINPSLKNQLGEEVFGNYQSILAVVSIMGTTFGVAANYSRMVKSKEKKDSNGDYNIFLTIIAVLSIAVSAVTLIVYKDFSAANFILMTVLTVFTVLRYYGDVYYRMKLNYRGFFLYYAVITAGYCLGLAVFRFLTKQAMLVMLLGEAAAVIFVFFTGNIFKGKNPLRPSVNFKENMQSVGILSATNLLSAVAQNADRIILKIVMGGEAVTTIYLATIMGKVVSLLTTPLNGVLIGYLTKYDGKITKRMFAVFTFALLCLGVIACFGCYIASLIFIKIFYPDSMEATKQYFFLANAGQVFFFISNCLMTVILRVASEKYQMYINIIYVAVYALLVLPLTVKFGIWGMIIGLLLTNAAKFAIVSVVGFGKSAKKSEMIADEVQCDSETTGK